MQFDPFERQNSFYKYDIKISKEEINQILILVKSKNTPDQKTTFESLNVLNFPLIKNLREQVISILDKKKLILRNNWAQLYNKNNQHTVHNHPSSVWSGIVYLNPSVASPTIFYDREFRHYTHAFTKNQFLLFPSYIPHEVARVNKDEQRLIISFNTMKCKK